jgi:hypothetical protein
MPTQIDDDQQPAAAQSRSRKQHTRSRTGCLTCRKRHRRCDERRPVWSVPHLSSSGRIDAITHTFSVRPNNQADESPARTATLQVGSASIPCPTFLFGSVERRTCPGSRSLGLRQPGWRWYPCPARPGLLDRVCPNSRSICRSDRMSSLVTASAIHPMKCRSPL